MKEQDIKKLFNAASEGRESDVNSEEIKNAVLEKLGKNSLSNSNVEGETVEPVFVTPQKKKNKFTALKIVAGTAAACLGVVVIGNIVNLNNDGFSTLSEGDSDTEVNLTEETLAEEALTEEISESTEATATNPSDTRPKGLSNTKTTLWDDTIISYNYRSEIVSLDFTNSFNIISEKDGRLYLLDSLMLTREDGTSEPDLDLTDYFNSNTPFVRTVTNEEQSQLLDFIVVGGNISDNDYGYVIMHKISYIDKWVQICKFSAKTTEMIGMSASDREIPQWYLDALEQIKEQFPNQEIVVAKDGCFKEYADFKDEEPAQTVDNTPIMSELDYTEPSMENPDLEFYLLDGTLFKHYAIDDSISESNYSKQALLLSEEKGKLYLVKNAGEIFRGTADKPIKEEITDKISSDDFYIYSYTNPDNTIYQTHYVIIGGDIFTGDYGYVELFKVNDKGEWEYSSCFSKGVINVPTQYSESKGHQWLTNGIKELEEKYGEKIIGYQNGGASNANANFKDAWAE